jgi:peptide/nickel transport system substrate-binding protein
MRPILYRPLAATSVIVFFLLAAAKLETARRPRYGGTLRVEMGEALPSLDPSGPALTGEATAARDKIDALLYDHRSPDGTFAGDQGAGPFRLAQWEPGKQATLAANDAYLGGRPFLDSVEIRLGRTPKERLLDIELGKADFAEIPPEEARRAAEHGVRVSTSQLDELILLAFVAARPVVEDPRAREAIARAIDRSAIANFILQKEGEPAGGLLPQWSSGTAFLFPTATDTPGAKELWSRFPASSKIVVGYDAGDALEQAVAERVAVNAREAGISLATLAVAHASPVPANLDARFVRWRMPSPHPGAALNNFLGAIGPLAGIDPLALADGVSPDQIYGRERAVINSYRVVPIVWLPGVYGLSGRVRDWKAPEPGEGWPLADVWLEEPAGSPGVP